jgi:hypothetical protein
VIDATLNLQPSRRLAAALMLAHTAVGAGLAASNGLSLPLLALALLALLASLAWMVHRHVRIPDGQTLHLRPDGTLGITMRDHSTWVGRVLPDSTIFSWLIVLRVRDEATGQKRSQVIFSDALDPESARQLRLWLRHCALKKPAHINQDAP